MYGIFGIYKNKKMKEDLTIKIRSNVLEEILYRLSDQEKREFDDIVEDSLISYFNIRLSDIESPITKEDNAIIIDDDVNHGYYVYVFMDPTIKKKIKTGINEISFNYEPFYIGKGIGNRIDNTERNCSVNSRVDYLRKNGMDPIIIRVKENMSNLYAHKLENYLIEKIGRSDIGKGPLLNLSGGISFVNVENIEFDFTDLNLERNVNSMILDSLNKSKTLREASKKLGMSERTMYRKIKDLDIIRRDNKYVFNKKAD